MYNPAKLIFSSALIGFCAVAVSQRELAGKELQGATLQEHYDAAQRLQRAGKLNQANDQFRAFLGNAIGELAVGRAETHQYARAESLFDEALTVTPEASHLRLEYARTALLQGDLPRAETLAKASVSDFPAGDSQHAAQAHQILGRTLHKMNRDQEARKELEAAVSLDPSFENGYDLAVVCLDLDDEKCAAQIFTEMQSSFGDTPAIHMTFGRAYGNSDFAPRAVEEFKKAIAENPRLPAAHYCLAAALLTTGQDEATLAAAQTELKKELEISPRDFLTYAALGKLAATHGNYPEAERYLMRATELNPNNPDAFLYLGQMEYDTNRFNDAEANLRRAIQHTSDPSRNRYQIQKAHFLLGRILMQQHREQEARTEMQVARALANKVLSHDKSELAGLLANQSATGAADDSAQPAPAQTTQGNTDSAEIRDLNAFEKRLTPAIADSYNNLGAIAAGASRYSEAVGYFERAAAWNPTLDGLDYNLGRAAFMASRFAEAVAPLRRYAASHPLDSGTRAALGMSEFMTGNYKGCIDALKGIQETIAAIPQMQYVYAESLVKLGDVSEGAERLTSLATQHPEIADVHRGLGEALALQGDKQKAAQELQTALRLNAKDPEAHYDLGKVELESGNTTAAIAELQSAVELAPDNPRFHQELAAAYKLAQRAADAERELKAYNDLQKSNPARAQQEKNP
ncbi:MAG TPA: tetratricopeptide repeat protein [Terracidiphilus sp.]|nr:tetratricopeptide repeat protein [Terracidiphilus sp.]